MKSFLLHSAVQDLCAGDEWIAHEGKSDTILLAGSYFGECTKLEGNA